MPTAIGSYFVVASCRHCARVLYYSLPPTSRPCIFDMSRGTIWSLPFVCFLLSAHLPFRPDPSSVSHLFEWSSTSSHLAYIASCHHSDTNTSTTANLFSPLPLSTLSLYLVSTLSDPPAKGLCVPALICLTIHVIHWRVHFRTSLAFSLSPSLVFFILRLFFFFFCPVFVFFWSFVLGLIFLFLFFFFIVFCFYVSIVIFSIFLIIFYMPVKNELHYFLLAAGWQERIDLFLFCTRGCPQSTVYLVRRTLWTLQTSRTTNYAPHANGLDLWV